MLRTAPAHKPVAKMSYQMQGKDAVIPLADISYARRKVLEADGNGPMQVRQLDREPIASRVAVAQVCGIISAVKWVRVAVAFEVLLDSGLRVMIWRCWLPSCR